MFDDGTGLACRDAIDTGECKMLNPNFVFNMGADACEVEPSATMCLADGHAANL